MTSDNRSEEVPAEIAPNPEPGLRVVGLAKAFGPTQALRSCSLEVRPGEVHALVGENGSGKSTLVKILGGVHRPDDGTVQVAGASTTAFGSPREAIEAGIATVFQEVLVVETQSVLENLWLGHDRLFRSRVGPGRRDDAERVLSQLLESPPALDSPVGRLSLSDRQACCIARALLREPRVLVLDEATSALDIGTRDRLFALIGELIAAGGSVIFISHRMDEIQALADRITVMRSGETVATLDGSASPDELVRLMTGAERLAPARAPSSAPAGEPVLVVRGLVLREGRRAVDLDVRAGELIGVAGLDGHGQDEFLAALVGDPVGGGTVECLGKPIGSPQRAFEQGIVYVPRERRAEALFESKSIRENFGLPTLARDRRAGLLSPGSTRGRLADYVEALGIRLGNPEDLITTLSGGNQQKVVIARWLASAPRVLVLNDPTRGIDLGAKRDLYRLLRELTSTGSSVVMLSTEVEEQIELMDRVLVFRDHELTVELRTDGMTETALVGAFFGQGGGRDDG